MRIYIGGDSWGCGEWGYTKETYSVTHKGLEQFLIDDGHTVTNKSRSARGNKKTYDLLVEADEHDVYIIFQTVSLRDNEDWNSLVTWTDFIGRNEELQADFYKKLSSLPMKIHILGGLEKINKDHIAQYPNLVPVIESIPEVLTEFKAETLRSYIGIYNFYDLLSHNIDIEVLDKLDDALNYWDDTVSNTEYFQPDGKHINRHGHRQVYNIVKKEIKGDWCSDSISDSKPADRGLIP